MSSGFTSVMDFHWCFKAVLYGGIAILKCLGSSKSKIFQTFRASPYPMCVTLWPQKILMFFCTSKLIWDYANLSDRVDSAGKKLK